MRLQERVERGTCQSKDFRVGDDRTSRDTMDNGDEIVEGKSEIGPTKVKV